MNLPKKFSTSLKERIGATSFGAFEHAMEQSPPVSVRINPKKGASLFAEEEKVPWCQFGRYLEKRPAFVFDPLYHAGAYYAQDASSMFFANAIDFGSDLKVLDLCAAPGGKSSLLLSFLGHNSLLVSNELVGKRTVILYENLVKWGCANNVVTCNRSSDFASFKGYFDVVMIDAPCSGEGMFRKDREAVEQWSEGLVAQCAIVQKGILADAIDLVRPGGILIYSTCTYEPLENEENIRWLYQNHGNRLEPVEIPIPADWGIQTVEIKTNSTHRQPGYYCYPHQVKGEGQFVAVVRVTQGSEPRASAKGLGKTVKLLTRNDVAALLPYVKEVEGPSHYLRNGDQAFAAPEKLASDMSLFIDRMNMKKAGTLLGRIIRGQLTPDHEMVMNGLASENMPRAELNLDQALDYMQRKNLEVPETTPTGWIVLTHRGLDIGLAKNLGTRINNHYPAEWRIRKEYPGSQPLTK